MRVPYAARRSNQSVLKEISPEYSLERLLLKLKLQYFGHLMQRSDSLEKTLMNEMKCVQQCAFYFILAALGLCRCAWAFSSCSEWGYSLAAALDLLLVVASLVAEHSL